MDNQKIILNVENLNTTFISDKKEIYNCPITPEEV